MRPFYRYGQVSMWSAINTIEIFAIHSCGPRPYNSRNSAPLLHRQRRATPHSRRAMEVARQKQGRKQGEKDLNATLSFLSFASSSYVHTMGRHPA